MADSDSKNQDAENGGIVVIGRNEGLRLKNCLESMVPMPYPVVYVDSGSSDNSVQVATELGALVVELSPDKPFSAARGRNEGFDALCSSYPDIEYVQFVDGDCQLNADWMEKAIKAFIDDPKLGAVIGHLMEIDADSTPYNKLCALEWKSDAGEIVDYSQFGGISMIRATVFRQQNGFNQNIIAGEDPELATRIGIAGHRIIKLDSVMAYHNADIANFGQWFKRAVRAGHAIAQRADLGGESVTPDSIKERRSTLFWGVGVPLLVVLFALPSQGASTILLLGYVLLLYRVYQYRKSCGDNSADAFLYARFLVVEKLANGLGLIRYYINRMLNRFEIIEYK